MQEDRIKNDLWAALGDDGRQIYSDQDIEVAIGRSLQEYSFYFPSLRVMGQATLVRAVKAGSTSFEIVGGLPTIGIIYVIGYGSAANESVTVASIEPTPYNTTILTITAPLVHFYYAGMLVSLPTTASSVSPVLGLQIVAGQDTYQLPLDFIKVEPESFSLAIGDRLSYKATDSYYDETAAISRLLGSTGYGRAAGWSGSSQGNGYPGVNIVNPSPFGNGGGVTSGTTFDFILNEIPFLVMNVPPVTGVKLYFRYYGYQTLASLPNNKSEEIILGAAANATHALATELSQAGDTKIEDYEEANSKSASALMATSKEFRERWSNLVQHKVYITSG